MKSQVSLTQKFSHVINRSGKAVATRNANTQIDQKLVFVVVVVYIVVVVVVVVVVDPCGSDFSDAFIRVEKEGATVTLDSPIHEVYSSTQVSQNSRFHGSISGFYKDLNCNTGFLISVIQSICGTSDALSVLSTIRLVSKDVFPP